MKRKEEKEPERGRDRENGSHLESFLLSSDRWKQQLPVLLITAMERLTGIEMGEWVGEGVKQEQRTADDERKLSEIGEKKKTARSDRKEEIRGEIWQWTARAYKSCSTDKMANRHSIKRAAIPARSGDSAKPSDTHSGCPNMHDKPEEQQEKDKGKQLRLRKLSLCLCHDPRQKDARLCSRNMLTCASAATTAARQRDHAAV